MEFQNVDPENIDHAYGYIKKISEHPLGLSPLASFALLRITTFLTQQFSRMEFHIRTNWTSLFPF